jgi:serine/threonine-protein kinase RsbW
MNRKKREEFELIIPSQIDQIRKVEDFTEKVVIKTSLINEERDSLAIAVTEIVNNAMIHGNKLNPDKHVIIHYTVTPHEFIISIKDEGVGFDPEKLEDPCKPENLLKDCGRGVFIVRSLLDEVRFQQEEVGMRVTLVKILK